MTGLCTTLGTQWIFYHGAATGDSYLTQLAQYIGMILVGLIIPVLLKNKQNGYQRVNEGEDHHMVQVNSDEIEESHEQGKYQEGPIQHKSVIRLAVLDVFANFCVTVGFSIVGSGMYQVIYSSVVIWCAILTFLFMGRKLSKLQWIAIFGTSAGLAISSLGNFTVEKAVTSEQAAKTALLMFGTLMTLGGTFFYSCVYVYSDYIMSQHKPPPLPARVCFYSGIYTSIISLVWIGFYTWPRLDEMIHIKEGTSINTVYGMYLLVTVANALHSWNYYELIDRTGSVSYYCKLHKLQSIIIIDYQVATGILQGLRAVLIYIISDSWYCKSDPAQCFTKFKGLGSLLVIGCVLLFTIGRAKSVEKKFG
ncbi:unnamed protein product [Mucor hiemalis]